MTMTDDNFNLTPKESLLMEYEKEEAERMREHAIRVKELELELSREEYRAKIELKKLESKWSSWIKLPALLIKLPVLCLLSLGYLIDCTKGRVPEKPFWELFK